jgi:hypothetical protein
MPTPTTLAVGIHPHHHLHSIVCTASGTFALPTSYHLPMLQLWEGWSLCLRLSFYQARESVQSSSACSEPIEGPAYRGPTPRSGPANYTTVEDILDGEEVLMSTFYLHSRPIIIPFHSEA